jgi:hypothetical protein
MNQMLKSSKSLLYLLVIGFLSGCAGPVKSPEELSARTTVESGTSECKDCYLIKTILSPTLQSDLYAVRDSQNLRTGQRISASIKLGATNRSGGFREGIALGRYGYEYGFTLAGEGHLFEGKTKTDANHPFRFFVQIHHNSSFGKQNVYLVSSKGEYVPLPDFSFRGVNYSQSCFSSGCVWDSDYAISAKYINRLIDGNESLKIFVGDQMTKDVKSKDGLNKGTETVNAGVTLEVRSAYLKSFIDTVKANLNIQED